MKSKTSLFSLLTLSLILSVFWLSARAQQPLVRETTPQIDGQMLSQILMEVRQLRAVVQHSGQNVYRGQILLEQLRAQQEKVSRLSGQLEELRAQKTSLKTLQPQMQERLHTLENEATTETNAVRRTQLEAETKAFRQFLETQNDEEQRRQERENQLVIQLSTEQSTLQELTEQMKTIEANLAENTTALRLRDLPRKNSR